MAMMMLIVMVVMMMVMMMKQQQQQWELQPPNVCGSETPPDLEDWRELVGFLFVYFSFAYALFRFAFTMLWLNKACLLLPMGPAALALFIVRAGLWERTPHPMGHPASVFLSKDRLVGGALLPPYGAGRTRPP